MNNSRIIIIICAFFASHLHAMSLPKELIGMRGGVPICAQDNPSYISQFCDIKPAPKKQNPLSRLRYKPDYVQRAENAYRKERELVQILAENRRPIFQLPEVELPKKKAPPLKFEQPQFWLSHGTDLNGLYPYCTPPLTSCVRSASSSNYTREQVAQEIARFKFLLENGACVNVKDSSGIDPLFQSVNESVPSMVKLCLAAGADPTSVANKNIYPSLLLCNIAGSGRALRSANAGDRYPVACLLVKHGADLNKPYALDKREGEEIRWTVLTHHCAEDRRLLKLFLENNAQIYNESQQWALPFLRNLQKKYYRKTQPKQHAKIMHEVATSPTNLDANVAQVIADYAVLNWREYTKQNEMRNIARGKALVEAGVENCEV